MRHTTGVQLPPNCPVDRLANQPNPTGRLHGRIGFLCPVSSVVIMGAADGQGIRPRGEEVVVSFPTD